MSYEIQKNQDKLQYLAGFGVVIPFDDIYNKKNVKKETNFEIVGKNSIAELIEDIVKKIKNN